jgi:glycosyltransferase involved in cell wall biosynthesis
LLRQQNLSGFTDKQLTNLIKAMNIKPSSFLEHTDKSEMNNKPRVSIGLPVYNGKQFLKEALDSILSQTFENFELIISDNASTDGTEEICREYAAKDRRIRYYRHEQNLGAAWNFNHVFELSTGEYFKWAAADDFCASNFLARCVEVLDNDPSVVVSCTKTIFTKSNGQRWWEGRSLTQLDSEKPHQRFQAVISDFWCLEVFGLIRKDLLSKTSLHKPYYGSDRLLLVELSLLGRFREIPESLFFRRCHSNQSSRLSPKEREVWIDPKADRRPKFLRPRGSLEYLRAILTTRLNWYDRMSCLNILSHHLFSLSNWKKFFFKRVPKAV